MFMRIVKISMNALTALGLGYMFYCIITGFISWICDCSVGGLVPLKCIIEDMYKFAPIALIASIIGILIFKNLFKLHSRSSDTVRDLCLHPLRCKLKNLSTELTTREKRCYLLIGCETTASKDLFVINRSFFIFNQPLALGAFFMEQKYVQ